MRVCASGAVLLALSRVVPLATAHPTRIVFRFEVMR